MTKGKIGLLPLYLKLYDDGDKDGSRRRHTELLPAAIAAEMEKRGVSVVAAPVCRIQKEFTAAVKALEEEGVDALVTLHLAYSPSLESAAALAGTKLPLIVLDTTPTFSYGPTQDPDEMRFNHGIHGVQDMCNLLIRNGKPFVIEAGHWRRSDVLDRVAALVPAARMAAAMRTARVGVIGGPFKGMGDFQVTPARMARTIGAEVKALEPERLKTLMASVKDAEVAAEVAEDLARFSLLNASPDAHRRSVKMGLAIRRWIEREGLSALTFNFQSMEKKAGYVTAPFLEMSKALGRGTGYAGEGDTLTAALVAALLSVFPDTSFTEMFCPDWENDAVFLSHMGEVNWRLLDGKPVLREMDFTYTKTDNPALVTGRFKPGKVTLVNIAPGVAANGGYRLITAPAEMLPVPGTDRHDEYIHGWLAPRLPVADFLARYSSLGGTHHLAVCYDSDARTIARFGELMGWEVSVIG
jgi:L-arabinose isomerase